MAIDQFASHVIDEFENKFESDSINDLFGGGYEMVAYHDGQLRKISDVVYVYAEAEFDSDTILQVELPKFLLKTTYSNEDLIIRSMEFHYEDEEEILIKKNDRTFTIPPITRYHDYRVDEDCEEVKLSGQFLCFVIKVKHPAGRLTIPFIRKYDGSLGFMTKAFIATSSGNHVSFNYSDIFLSELQDHIRNYMHHLLHP